MLRVGILERFDIICDKGKAEQSENTLLYFYVLYNLCAYSNITASITTGSIGWSA